MNKTFGTRFIGRHRTDKMATSDISQVNHLQSISKKNDVTNVLCRLQKGQSMIFSFGNQQKKRSKDNKKSLLFLFLSFAFVRWPGDKTL